MATRFNIVATCSVISVGLVAFLWYRKCKNKEKVPKKWKPVGKVGELHIYPLKSGKKIEVKEAECTIFGLLQITDEPVFKLTDRCLVVYGEGNYEFKTARTFPKMVLIEVSNHDVNHVALNAPNMQTLFVKIPNTRSAEILKISMHAQEVTEIVDCGNEAANWLSKYIKGEEKGLRLGYHDETMNIRYPRTTFAPYYPQFTKNDTGIFSDFTSFMLMNKASVDDLNSRLENDVSFCQFRPNILVENVDSPYVEDSWEWIKIGENATFRNVKLCTRCSFTTIDPETGIMHPKKEPLKTLKSYRQLPDEKQRKLENNSPVMGIHLGLRTPGIIKINDIVYVGEK